MQSSELFYETAEYGLLLGSFLNWLKDVFRIQDCLFPIMIIQIFY